MDIEKDLEMAKGTGHLVLLVFHTGDSSRYDWMDSILRTHAKRKIELLKVNAAENRFLANSMNINAMPTYVLIHRNHELWRQIGELSVKGLKEMLDDF